MRRHPKPPICPEQAVSLTRTSSSAPVEALLTMTKVSCSPIGHRHRLAQQQRPAAAGIDEADGAEPFCKTIICRKITERQIACHPLGADVDI